MEMSSAALEQQPQPAAPVRARKRRGAALQPLTCHCGTPFTQRTTSQMWCTHRCATRASELDLSRPLLSVRRFDPKRLTCYCGTAFVQAIWTQKWCSDRCGQRAGMWGFSGVIASSPPFEPQPSTCPCGAPFTQRKLKQKRCSLQCAYEAHQDWLDRLADMDPGEAYDIPLDGITEEDREDAREERIAQAIREGLPLDELRERYDSSDFVFRRIARERGLTLAGDPLFLRATPPRPVEPSLCNLCNQPLPPYRGRGGIRKRHAGTCPPSSAAAASP